MVIWGSPHFKNPLPLMVTRGPFSRSSPAGGFWTLECADAHGYCRTFIFCPTWGCTCTNQQPVVFFGWYHDVPKIGNEWVFIYSSSWSVFLLLSLFLLSVLVVVFLFPRLFSNEWSPASWHGTDLGRSPARHQRRPGDWCACSWTMYRGWSSNH